MAHVVDTADNAAAEPEKPEHEIQYGKTNGAADNGFFLAAGDIQFTEFHPCDYSAHNSKYGAGCSLIHRVEDYWRCLKGHRQRL